MTVPDGGHGAAESVLAASMDVGDVGDVGDAGDVGDTRGGGAVKLLGVVGNDTAEGRRGSARSSLVRERVALRVLRGDEDLDVSDVGDEAEGDEDTDDTDNDASQRRMRRAFHRRATTDSMKRLSKRSLEIGRMQYPVREHDLGVARDAGECASTWASGEPCPYVSCEHHLLLDVNEATGSIKWNFPPRDDSPEALEEVLRWMEHTCALKVAAQGGLTLEEVGDLLNLTRERVRQIEARAFEKITKATEWPAILELFEEAQSELPSLAKARGRSAGGSRIYTHGETIGDSATRLFPRTV